MNKLLCSGMYNWFWEWIKSRFSLLWIQWRSFQQNTETDSGSNTSLLKLKWITGHSEAVQNNQKGPCWHISDQSFASTSRIQSGHAAAPVRSHVRHTCRLNEHRLQKSLWSQKNWSYLITTMYCCVMDGVGAAALLKLSLRNIFTRDDQGTNQTFLLKAAFTYAKIGEVLEGQEYIYFQRTCSSSNKPSFF